MTINLRNLQIERMKDLAFNTHILFNEKGARKYTDPFGIHPKLRKYHAQPNDPKGLTLNDGASWAMGIASWDLAYQIYNHFGLTDAESKMGRGSQQREYCYAVIRHLEKQQIEAS